MEARSAVMFKTLAVPAVMSLLLLIVLVSTNEGEAMLGLMHSRSQYACVQMMIHFDWGDSLLASRLVLKNVEGMVAGRIDGLAEMKSVESILKSQA